MFSRNGTATFSATVSDEKSAPSWNSTPKRRRTAFSSCGLQFQTSVPSSSMLPAVGRMRPMISRSSTDLPLPLPPMNPTTSPRRTVKLTPSCTTCLPNRVTTDPTFRTSSIQISRRWSTMANSASSTIAQTMHCTTVEVVFSPTLRASRATTSPMRQAMRAMKTANTGALASPTTT